MHKLLFLCSKINTQCPCTFKKSYFSHNENVYHKCLSSTPLSIKVWYYINFIWITLTCINLKFKILKEIQWGNVCYPKDYAFILAVLNDIKFWQIDKLNPIQSMIRTKCFTACKCAALVGLSECRNMQKLSSYYHVHDECLIRYRCVIIIAHLKSTMIP